MTSAHLPSPRRQRRLPAALISILGPSLLFVFTGTAGAQSEVLRGHLDVQWGDELPELDRYVQVATLATDDGRLIELELDRGRLGTVGGVHRFIGRRVEITLVETPTALRAASPRPRVSQLRVLPEPGLKAVATKMVSGSQPWVSILCKFADVANEPESQAFFQNMYDNSSGRLDHYWRETSYDIIDIAGSTSSNWVTLAGNQTTYVPTPGSGCFGSPSERADLTALFNACTAAADASIDFSNGGSPFQGINMMFNAELDGCAWGGSRYATLDGVTKSWRVTWEPPFGYADAGVIAHEMGHGFGLPHSNNSDGDGSPYDSPWDVMSSATGYSVLDATYGRLGKHTIAYHKDRLGWIAPAELFEVASPGIYTITIDHAAAASTANYRMAEIPIPGGSTYYTVEARYLVGDYESNLPGAAVIIHEVDPFRSEPAWVLDGNDPPASYSSTEGVMWKVGETFTDAANEIQVEVLNTTANGFSVRITSGTVASIFTDGFETGDTTQWSSSL